MANFGAADVDALLADQGLPITVGADTVNGIVDRSDQTLLESGIEGAAAYIGRAVLATVHTGGLTTLAIGGAITVDGDSYVVVSDMVIEDGELTVILCAVA